MSRKYIIFDFDGTLVNTNDIILESWQVTFMHYLGHRLDEKEILATFGETLKHTIAEKIPGASYEEVRDYYRAYQDANCEGRVYVFPGVRELLDELKAEGYKLAVATSRTLYTYRKYMEELGLSDYIDVAVTMEDVSRHKPDPECALRVLEKLGAAPDEALFVGDTKYDIGCANSAGIDSVLVGWSHWIDEEDMIRNGIIPVHYISEPSDLLAVLKAQ